MQIHRYASTDKRWNAQLRQIMHSRKQLLNLLIESVIDLATELLHLVT